MAWMLKESFQATGRLILVPFVFQTMEWKLGRPLFNFAGSEAYLKDTTEHPIKSTLHVGNMGIPVAVFEEGDLEPHETKISFADDSGKPIQTVVGDETQKA